MSTQLYRNGGALAAADFASALVNYGHFTSMQVRGGAVQGLDLHLQRLQQATAELFGSELELAQVRAWMRSALAASGLVDASLRVTVYAAAFDFRHPARALPADVLVAVGPPVDLGSGPLRVRPARFQRELPHIKHVGTFPLFAQRRQAVLDGFDDALFVADDGAVLEGTTWSLVLGQGEQLVFPQGASLVGTACTLLAGALAAAGTPPQRAVVPLSGLDGFDAAVACNASGLVPVAAIGQCALPGSLALQRRLAALLAAQPWQPI